MIFDFLAKSAAAPAGLPARLVRYYAPVGDRRDSLEPFENEEIQSGQSQWLPKLLQTDATPIPSMMASPGRQGVLAALAGAAAGGAAGYFGGPLLKLNPQTAGIAGGIGGGAAAGIGRALGQYHQNEHLKETMRRLPPGATKRDYDAERLLGEAFENKYGFDLFAKLAAFRSLRGGTERKFVPGEDCSHCGACLEMGEGGKCNQCGKPYHTGPLGKKHNNKQVEKVVKKYIGDHKPIDSAAYVRHDGKEVRLSLGDAEGDYDKHEAALKALLPKRVSVSTSDEGGQPDGFYRVRGTSGTAETIKKEWDKEAKQRICSCGEEMRGAWCPHCHKFNWKAAADIQELVYKQAGVEEIPSAIKAMAPAVEEAAPAAEKWFPQAAKSFEGILGKAAPAAEAAAPTIGNVARSAASEGTSLNQVAAPTLRSMAGEAGSSLNAGPGPSLNLPGPEADMFNMHPSGRIPPASSAFGAMPAESAPWVAPEAAPGSIPPPEASGSPPGGPASPSVAPAGAGGAAGSTLGANMAHRAVPALGSAAATYFDPAWARHGVGYGNPSRIAATGGSLGLGLTPYGVGPSTGHGLGFLADIGKGIYHNSQGEPDRDDYLRWIGAGAGGLGQAAEPGIAAMEESASPLTKSLGGAMRFGQGVISGPGRVMAGEAPSLARGLGSKLSGGTILGGDLALGGATYANSMGDIANNRIDQHIQQKSIPQMTDAVTQTIQQQSDLAKNKAISSFNAAIPGANLTPEGVEQVQQTQQVVSGMQAAVDSKDPAQIAAWQQAHPAEAQKYAGPNGQLNPEAAKSDLVKQQMAPFKGTIDIISKAAAQGGIDQIANQLGTTGSDLMAKLKNVMPMLSAGGSQGAGALAMISHVADSFFNMIGLNAGQMSGAQKLLVFLGGVGLIGSAIGGSNIGMMLGGAALGAGLFGDKLGLGSAGFGSAFGPTAPAASSSPAAAVPQTPQEGQMSQSLPPPLNRDSVMAEGAAPEVNDQSPAVYDQRKSLYPPRYGPFAQ